MTEKEKKELLKPLKFIIREFYPFLGFLHVSKRMNTNQRSQSYFTLSKVDDMMQFIYKDGSDMLIRFDLEIK